MHKNSVSIWSPGNPIKTCLVLYRKQDENEFKRIVNITKNYPQKSYQLAPSVCSEEDIYVYYITLINNLEISSINFSSIGLGESTTVKLERLNKALSSWEIDIAHNVLELLISDWEKKDKSISDFFYLIDEILQDVLSPLMWEAPFTVPNPVSTHKTWWNGSPDLKLKVDNLINKTKNKLFNNGSASSAFLNWLNELSNHLGCLSGVKATALNEASVYCMARSLYYLKIRKISLAVLFCHRAADLLLMLLCTNNNLIDYSRNKPQFRCSPNGRNGSKEIHLMASYAAIKPILSYDAGRDSTFKDLNDLRNHLIYTHYLGCADESSARIVIESIRKHLKALAGNTWDHGIDKYATPYEISIKLLFEYCPTLSSALIEEIWHAGNVVCKKNI
jgi:hypothetical protein